MCVQGRGVGAAGVTGGEGVAGLVGSLNLLTVASCCWPSERITCPHAVPTVRPTVRTAGGQFELAVAPPYTTRPCLLLLADFEVS